LIDLSLCKGMSTSVVAARAIARRYQSTVVLRDEPATEIIMSNGGIITTGDLRRLLEPRLGMLVNMRLRPSLEGAPNTIAWEALNEDAEVVSGRVVLHAHLTETEIAVWADLVIDEGGSMVRFGTVRPRQLLEDRLRRIADMARRLVTRVRVQPQVPAHSIVEGLVGIVELAEGK